jgi:hypothetical protein
MNLHKFISYFDLKMLSYFSKIANSSWFSEFLCLFCCPVTEHPFSVCLIYT